MRDVMIHVRLMLNVRVVQLVRLTDPTFVPLEKVALFSFSNSIKPLKHSCFDGLIEFF